VTIEDVARAVGTSTASVSRALNGQRGVSRELVERIRAAATELGYAPNVAAQQLRQSRTKLIAIVVSDLANIIRNAWVQAAEERAEELGYNVVLVDVRLSSAALDRTLDYLMGQPLEGVVVASSIALPPDRIEALRRRGIPIVPEGVADPAQYQRDRRQIERDAVRDMVKYLAHTGHSGLVTITHSRYSEGDARLLDIRNAVLRELCDQEGIGFTRVTDTGPADTAAEVRRLALESGGIAVVSLTHFEVPWCLQLLRDAGLRLPDDVSFVTFGDSEWARAWNPPLSVVARDMQADARRYIDVVVAQIEGEPVADENVSVAVPSQFILRGSTPDRRPRRTR